MEIFPLFMIIIIVYSYCISIFAQTLGIPGKVFIGEGENDTVSSFSFSANQPVATFLIPVYVEIYNASIGAPAVNVTCGVDLIAVGYSTATFQFGEIGIGNPSVGPFFGTIPFHSPVAGRSSKLQCWCVGPPPFTKAVTLSDTKSFIVYPAGVVNLYNSVYTMGQPIYVKLSQVAQGNSVLVSCTGLSFQPRLFPVGSQILEVTYTPRYDVSSSFNISCSGQSQNNGYQFLSANSAGKTAMVAQYVPVVLLQPNRAILNRAKMQAILSINRVPPTESITFTCTVATVKTWNEVANITSQVGCASVPGSSIRPVNTTTVLPPSYSFGSWKLQDTVFVFSNNDLKSYLFRILWLERMYEVREPRQELVVTRCCSTGPVSNNPFLNSTAVMVAAVTLTPPLYINWTLASASVNMTLETPIIDPAFKNLAPCPCNLTAGMCDANCCCDTECSPLDIQVFSCIEGYFGGMEGEKSHDFCGATYHDTPGWFPIMCIHKENNGFLGRYFYPRGLIRNQTAFDATSSRNFEYSFRNSHAIVPGEPNGSSLGYKKGLSIKTGLQVPPATFLIGPNYILTLPQGKIWSPVQFLVDTKSDWVQNMSQSSVLCARDSPLSALMYAQSPAWGTATGPVVLREQGQATVTSINVSFLCDNSGAKYQGSNVTFKDVFLPSEVRLFGLPSDTGDDCRFDEITGAYVCGNYSVGGAPVLPSLPPRCGWDNGFTMPPEPVKNDASNTCNNAVVRASYDFTWDGQSVLHLSATIILAPVALTLGSANTPVMLTQQFAATFLSQTSNSSMVEKRGTLPVLPVSGKPGYDTNRPVISGISVLRNGSSDVQYIDTNTSSRVSLWNPGFSSLCDGASRSPVLFGVSSIGQCTLRLSLDSFKNCDLLRIQVLSGQDSLMPSDYISLVGNPYADNLTDWTKIIREDISHIFNNTLPTRATGAFTFQTTQGQQMTTGSPSPPTSSSSSSYRPPSSNEYRELKGRCFNIPSGIELEVLYAVAGKSNYQPIHRIVGAKIRYTLSTWHWSCAGPGSASCRANSTLVQSFRVTSTVNFVEVPPEPVPELSRYEKKNYAPSNICRENICWSQIFYPFMKLSTVDSQQHAVALGLAFLLFIIYFVLLTFPFCGEILKLLQS